MYLDHAATTPTRPEVVAAMEPFASDVFGNSSGIHGVSRRAKNALEEARERAAVVIGARPIEIVFTSGGTESDNLALKGAAFNSSPRRGVVTAATEHEAVLETADFLKRIGMPVTIVGVDAEGRVSPEEMAAAVTGETAVVSVMLVNNETGTVQPVIEIARAVKEADPDALVHTDAVQAFNSIDVDVEELGVDMLSLSGHKFGGPKGCGLLFVREGTTLEPVQHGGGQELGRRSGTHDVAGAVGLVAAMELAAADRERFRLEIGAIRDEFTRLLREGVEDAAPNTPPEGRSPHHLNIRFPGVSGQILLMRLDQAGVAASAGSACQSGAATVSHVLEAMGLGPDEARECVRFTFGWTSTGDEAEVAAKTVVELAGELR
ncbi:MAG: cysteine desulfurase [Actinobacteria bacterium]|nr:cysteine desulfurase [Actinomycetota bacterium]